MVTQYRIVTNQKSYRVQARFFLFWMTAKDEFDEPLEFSSVQEAKSWIEIVEKENEITSRPWDVVWTSKER